MSEADPQGGVPPPAHAVRVREIFDRAASVELDLRDAYLASECGSDVALRREIESLLRAAASADAFLSRPAGWGASHDLASSLPSPSDSRGSTTESAAAPPLLRAGQLVAGRYRVAGLLGRGNMGEVYEAEDVVLGTKVALKCIRRGSAWRPDALARFKREVLLARRVTHPSACRVFDFGHEAGDGGGVAFLTMELLDAEPLSRRLRERGRLRPDELVPILRDLAGALDAAHRAGVVHRDLKPGNVLLVRSGAAERAVVTDFGLADDFTSRDVERETPGIRGTPAYLAPEQVTGDDVGPRADMYALGVLLYEALTGALPFRGESPLATALARLDATPPRPSDLVPDLDEAWDRAIARCLARAPDDRFESAAALLAFVAEAGDDPSPAAHASGRLPVEANDFVGREWDLRALDTLFDDGARVVTIFGTAGIGKTRLAIRHAARARSRWPGGVFFSDLAQARTVGDVLRTVAGALDAPIGARDPAGQLGHAIAARGRCLLVFDDCEGACDATRDLVEAWRGVAADAAFLITTRERLRIPDERVLELSPLTDEDAVELFVSRTRSHARDAAVAPDAIAEIRDLVRRLDALPLAIELAASRAAILSVRQLRERLDERFRLLAGAGATGRHATLRVAIATSWESLAPHERAAWAHASVFEGGFSLEAAEQVVDLSAWPDAPWLVDVLQSLVDKSVLRVEGTSEGDAGAPRFHLLASLQDYGRSELSPTDLRAAQDRHAAYHATLGEESALEQLERPGGVARRRRLALELDNVLAACRHAVRTSRGDLATALLAAAWAVLDLSGPVTIVLELGREVLAQGTLADADRARAARLVGTACWRAAQVEEGQATFEEGLAAARRAGDERVEALLLLALGCLHFDGARMDVARDHYERAFALHRKTGHRRLEGLTLCNLGNVDFECGRTEEARAHFEAAVAIAREVGDRRGEGVVLGNLAVHHFEQARMDEAREGFEAALAIHREVGSRRFEGEVLGNLAGLHAEQGRLVEARAHFERALALARTGGDRRAEAVWRGNVGNVLVAQGLNVEARASYEHALLLHRETGNARFEADVLARLGMLDVAEGRLPEARARLEPAARIHGELGDRRSQGRALGGLATIAAREGDAEGAAGLFARAEELLRGGSHRFELAELLSARARSEVAARQHEAARATLAEAEFLARAIGADGLDAALGRELARARAEIAAQPRLT